MKNHFLFVLFLFSLITYLVGKWWDKKQETQWKEYESNLLINYDIHNYITNEDCLKWKEGLSHELECYHCRRRHNYLEKKKIIWAKNFFANAYQKSKEIPHQKRSTLLDAINKICENKSNCSPSNNYEFNMEWRRVNNEEKGEFLEKHRKNIERSKSKKLW